MNRVLPRCNPVHFLYEYSVPEAQFLDLIRWARNYLQSNFKRSKF